jgi:hypothetical protein
MFCKFSPSCELFCAGGLDNCCTIFKMTEFDDEEVRTFLAANIIICVAISQCIIVCHSLCRPVRTLFPRSR